MPENILTQAYMTSFKRAATATRRVFGEDMTEEQLLFSLTPGGTNIYWTLGHLVWTNDSLFNLAHGFSLSCPEHFQQRFEIATKPPTSLTGMPSVGELLTLYDEVQERALANHQDRPDSLLDEPFPEGTPLHMFFRTPRRFYDLFPFHTGYHAGQVSLLRRAQGLPSKLMG